MKKWLPILLIILLGIICYSNIFRNAFLFDDPDIILNNKAIQNIFDIKSVLFTNYWHSIANGGLYRPVVFFTYALDYHFWQTDPMGYHITNLVFHIATCLILYLLVLVLIRQRSVAMLSALFYAVHPVHTEAVTGIVGRAEVIMTCFFCLGWLAFLKGCFFYKRGVVNKVSFHVRRTYIFISYVCYFLALCSKENAVVLPIVLSISVWMLSDKRKIFSYLSKLGWVFFGYIIIFSVYMVLRWKVIGSIGPVGSERFFNGTSNEVVFFTMCRVLVKYAGLLLIPTNLLCSYRSLALSHFLFEWRVFFSFIFDVCWIISAIYFFRKKTYWRFFLLFILVTLLPVSNIIRIGDIMAERFLYLPSIGFAVCLAILFQWACIEFKYLLQREIAGVICLMIICLCVFSIGTLNRNAQWRDGIVFWQTTLKDIPTSPSAHYNLALWYTEKGAPRRAIKILLQSLKFNPNDIKTRKYLAELYYSIGKYDRAIAENIFLLKYVKTRSYVYNNLALNYFKKEQYQRAIQYCQDGFSYATDSKINLYHTFARIYLNTQKINDALRVMCKSVEYDSTDTQSYILLGEIYKRLGEFMLAEKNLKKALSYDPDNLHALDLLASIYYKEKKYSEAIKVWQYAIKRYPSQEYIWYYIGLSYEHLNDFKLAVRSWRAIKKDVSYQERAKERIKKLKHR